jgi:hypothetical protein
MAVRLCPSKSIRALQVNSNQHELTPPRTPRSGAALGNALRDKHARSLWLGWHVVVVWERETRDAELLARRQASAARLTRPAA